LGTSRSGNGNQKRLLYIDLFKHRRSEKHLRMMDTPVGRPIVIPERLCVYTALVGDYEQLNEQPAAKNSDIPFICFTDDAQLRSDTWEVRQISCLLHNDPIRSQREIKLRPHEYLPEFEASLYIDNSVLLIEQPEAVFQKYFPASGLALPGHSYRQNVTDEFLEVYKLGFDDHARILEQLNHYALSWPEVLDEKPYWGGIQLRNHRNAQARALLDLWMIHVLRYSRRDQLSINYVAHQLGFKPDMIEIDNNVSWFHNWPLERRRVRDKGLRSPLASLAPTVARIRMMEQEIQKLDAERAEHAARIPALEKETQRLAAEIETMRRSHKNAGLHRCINALAAQMKSLARL
jgi:hypothetical protein